MRTAQGQFEQARLALLAAENQTSQQYQDLNNLYRELSNHYSTLERDFKALQAELEVLRQPSENVTTPAINTGDVEQKLFTLINQERKSHGLAEFMWGKNLYWYATTNGQNMAANKSQEHSSYASWQEVFRATGYRSGEDMASAAMVVWKNRSQYQQNFLNTVPTYGAVGVYQSGDIFYITYIASQFQ